jgi:hypothetical protein
MKVELARAFATSLLLMALVEPFTHTWRYDTKKRLSTDEGATGVSSYIVAHLPEFPLQELAPVRRFGGCRGFIEPDSPPLLMSAVHFLL